MSTAARERIRRLVLVSCDHPELTGSTLHVCPVCLLGEFELLEKLVSQWQEATGEESPQRASEYISDLETGADRVRAECAARTKDQDFGLAEIRRLQRERDALGDQVRRLVESWDCGVGRINGNPIGPCRNDKACSECRVHRAYLHGHLQGLEDAARVCEESPGTYSGAVLHGAKLATAIRGLAKGNPK